MFFLSKKKNLSKENDISNKEFINNIEETEIDPLAEADVYMAYERHEQAITILNEALKNKKITEIQYNNFIESHNLKEANKKNIQKLSEQLINYKYYISFTVGNEKSIIRQRVFVETNNSIHTEKGIKEIENFVEEIIKSIFMDSLFTTTWTLDSYIEINKE